MEAYADQLIATLLISLRIVPALAFSPPFTLLRFPAIARVLLALSLAAWIVSAHPEETSARAPEGAQLIATSASELLLGLALSVSLQLAFAALQTMGRAIDVQIGFGFAQLADPTLRSQMPLVGTLFSYAAAAIFFSTSGPADLLAVWSQSVERTPLGAFSGVIQLPLLTSYVSTVFILSVGVAGLLMLALFVIDGGIAMMSRTLPQMNVLVLGFQVKTLAALVLLPFTFALSAAAYLRIVRLALTAAPRLI